MSLHDTDPQKLVDYKMEIERNPTMRSLPLFRVSPEDGKPVYSFLNLMIRHFYSHQFAFVSQRYCWLENNTFSVVTTCL